MPRNLKFFVSYAHADQPQPRRLLELLQPRLQIVKEFWFSAWIDDEIRVRNHWTDEIDDALQSADFGLLLLSPSFFASGFIRTNEIPHFVELIRNKSGSDRTRVRKPLVPVLLKPIPLDGSADLAGIEQLQIFRDTKGSSFSETRGHTRDAFADQLTTAMVTKLRGLYPNGS